MPPKAPWLPYDRLREIGHEFLNEHHPSFEIPIPIDDIVEFDFHMDVVAMPGLHRAFDIDSFITSDLREIRVDQFVYESRPGRYRFSLAHELSHRLIHQDVFKELSFSSLEEWQAAVTSIPQKDYGIIEWQANSLGGLILVPPEQLRDALDDAVQKAAAIGVSPDDLSDAAREMIEGYLAEHFVVSPAVIQRRVEYDKLWDD